MRNLPVFITTALVLAGCNAAIVPGRGSDATNSVTPTTASRPFKFRTIVNPADRTFNEALGINNSRTVAGYYGSGAVGHPSQGYTAVPGFAKNDFTAENFPGAVQTQVTAINGSGDTAGIWLGSSRLPQGFIDWKGTFTSYNDPAASGGTEILGLNDSGIAVGFYVGPSNQRYGFTLDRATGTFTGVTPPGASNVTAAGVNDGADIVGYYSSGSTGSNSVGFLEKNGTFTAVAYPGAVSTMALGVNAHDAVVGTYVDAYGKTHGFLLRNPLNGPTYLWIDDPQGAGTTTLNGINDRINMVGYYVDTSGNTIGLLVERKKM